MPTNAADVSAVAAPIFDSLPKIIRKIPRHCFERDETTAWAYFARDLALAVFTAWVIVAVDSWWLAPVLAVLLGSALTGLFVVGHDAGHRSFSNSERVNNAVGHVATSLTLWPFHVWRLSHDHHHRWTHHADKEIAWRPLTVDEFDGLSPLKRWGYVKFRTTVFFGASLLFQYFVTDDARKGRFFDQKEAAKLKFSMIFTAAVGVAYIATTLLVGGLYGFVFLFLIPQIVFQAWMSTFTLLHHTSTDHPVMSADVWTAEKAQLGSSIHVNYSPLVDWLTHDIAWHVPHHVCVGIPHYKLRDAHRALKGAYPEVVTERDFSFELLNQVLDNCHLIRSTAPGEQAWLKARDGIPVPAAEFT